MPTAPSSPTKAKPGGCARRSRGCLRLASTTTRARSSTPRACPCSKCSSCTQGVGSSRWCSAATEPAATAEGSTSPPATTSSRPRAFVFWGTSPSARCPPSCSSSRTTPRAPRAVLSTCPAPSSARAGGCGRGAPASRRQRPLGAPRRRRAQAQAPRCSLRGTRRWHSGPTWPPRPSTCSSSARSSNTSQGRACSTLPLRSPTLWARTCAASQTTPSPSSSRSSSAPARQLHGRRARPTPASSRPSTSPCSTANLARPRASSVRFCSTARSGSRPSSSSSRSSATRGWGRASRR
mmetsp:Transcript_13599/g.31983  ORF Transcript_13599/g.31983 Transcript_13599/m.31983 type:complete len:294 (+) Transcript_13599:74-955(+)